MRDLYDRDHPSLPPEASAAEARRLVRSRGVRVVPVVDEHTGKLIGLVRRSSLLLVSSTRTNATVGDLAEEPVVVLEEEASAVEAMKSMIASDEWYSPVVIPHTKKYLGVLGLEHFIEWMLASSLEVLEHPVSKYMTSEGLITVKPLDPVYRAWQLMMSRRLSALPVVTDDGRLLGVVAEYDLLSRGFSRPRLESDEMSRGPRVREVMSTPAVAVTPETPLREVAKLIVRRNIGRVYVVDEVHRLVGVVDREDVVKAYLKFIGALR